MHAQFLRELCELLSGEMPFHYFTDREAAWLLARRVTEPVRLADLNGSPLGNLLQRPLLKALAARCGDGWLRPADLAPLADPIAALAPTALTAPRSRAPDTALGAADWRAYTITFTSWGMGEGNYPWNLQQISRPGGNLVLQLNFPQSHQVAFNRGLKPGMRKALEIAHHPIRTAGPITMAWARLDMDPWGADLLIEELQSDWFKMVRDRVAYLRDVAPDGRELAALAAYEALVLKRYAKDWEQALMLAVLDVAVRELGIERIWLHQPESGARLKNIVGVTPPRSLYTRLPKRFLFEPVRAAPAFLGRREKTLKRLRAGGGPVFWRLAL
ncbi:MAG: hypothetical protein ACFBRM_06000 [Pikeienuella sp.]